MSSAGAKSVRLGLLVKALPGTARLRVYRQSHPDDLFEIAGQSVLQLLERERNEEASQALREHLGSTLRNLGRISDILQPGAASDAPSSIPV